jgi:16S rRNA processing protein RimM
VGYVRRAHGVEGAVLVRATTDDPDRFVAGAVFSTDSPTDPVVTVVRVRAHRDGLLLDFAGIEDRTRAEQLRGRSIFITSDQRRELETDEYWPEDLVGLRVVDQTGKDLGKVDAVIAGSAQDRLAVAGPGGRFEIPFVAALVPEVDVPAGFVLVDPPEGLTEPD